MWGGVAGVATASGPILGGILVSTVGWRAVFFVNVPIGLGAMVLTARCVPAPDPEVRAFDPAAQLTAVLALAALTLALIQGGRAGFTLVVIAAAGVGAAATLTFVGIERSVASPMLPLALFANSSFSGANAVGLLINLGFYGELFVINLYFQQVLRYSALLAGLALLPQMGMASIASLLSGRLTGRAGSPRPAMLTGLLVGAAGLLGLLLVGAHTPYLVLVAPLAAAGFGMAFTMPAATTAVVEGAPADRAGLASGAINAARQVGGVIGVALLGAFIAGHADFLSGFRAALIIAGAAFLAGAGITAVTIDRPLKPLHCGFGKDRDGASFR